MSNSQKLPFQKTFNNAIKAGAEDQSALGGRSLPCHVVAVQGQIVTVQFDMLPDGVQYPQVTIPIATFQYLRFPIQKGDKGVTVAADVSLKGVSGLGTGIAARAISFSLVPLFFVPLANAGWTQEDPNKIVLYGPDGGILKTIDGKASINVSKDSIVLAVGSNTLKLSSDGLHHNGVDIGSTHTHDVEGVESGGSTKTTETPN